MYVRGLLYVLHCAKMRKGTRPVTSTSVSMLRHLSNCGTALTVSAMGVLGSIGKNRPDAVISAAMIWDISAQPGPPGGGLSEASDAAIENRSPSGASP
jgi:hypothetical protein